MGDDYAPPGEIESGSSFDADVSPTVFTVARHAGGQGEGNRGGYSNLGLQLPATPCAGVEDDGDDEDDDVETMAGGFLAVKPKSGGGRRKNKMAYVGLGDGDDGSAELSVSSESIGEAPGADETSWRLAIFALLNLGYVVLQLAGALAFNSLALMSDGFHNLSDV